MLRVPRAVESALEVTVLVAALVEVLALVGSRERVLEEVGAVAVLEVIRMRWAAQAKPVVRVHGGRLRRGVEAEPALAKRSVLAAAPGWAVQGLFSVLETGGLAHPWFR